jgi:hypothetical protein
VITNVASYVPCENLLKSLTHRFCEAVFMSRLLFSAHNLCESFQHQRKTMMNENCHHYFSIQTNNPIIIHTKTERADDNLAMLRDVKKGKAFIYRILCIMNYHTDKRMAHEQ